MIGPRKQKQGCCGQAFVFARQITVKKSVETTAYEGIKYSECTQSLEWRWAWCKWLSLKPWFAPLALMEGQKSQLLVIAKPFFGQYFQIGLLWGSLTMPHNMFIHWNLCLAFLLSYPQGKSRIRHRSRETPAEKAAREGSLWIISEIAQRCVLYGL